MNGLPPPKGRIARRLIVAVVLFSSVITLVTTGFQLYRDYDKDVGEIRHNLDLVESTYLPSLTTSVWIADEQQIWMQLEGLLALPDVQKVSLAVEGGVVYQSGHAAVPKALTRTYDLVRNHRGVDMTIATLEISASVGQVIERLIERGLVILVGNGVKTFLVAGFILLIFHILVTRHLGVLARYAQELTVADRPAPLQLPRRNRAVPDELDDLAEAIRGLAVRVQSSYRMLQDSERRFRDYAQASSDWYWETGPDLRINTVSEKHQDITGLDPSVYLGLRREEFPGLIIDPGRLAEHQQVMERRLPFRDFTYAIRTPDGQIRHIQTSGRPRRDRDGKFLGYRGVARDVTDAVRADEERQRTELQLARAIEVIPAACALFDEEDRLIICNKTYRQLFERVGTTVEAGATFETLIRRYVEAGGIDGTDEEIEAWLARRLTRRRRPEKNFEYLRADGHWAEVSDYLLDDGRVLHFASDVTARKRAEERAQAERAKTAEYLQVAQTLIVVLDRDGHVELLNRYGCELLGYSIDEIVGKDWFSTVLPPDIAKKTRRGFDSVMAGERPLEEYREHDVLTRTGALRRIAWSNRPLRDEDGNIDTVLSSGLDITEHLAAEEALRQAQRMDALGKLTGGIAHDFNNLLAIILGNLDLIHERLPEDSNLDRLVEPAISAAERGAALTTRLLAFSRKQPLQPRTVNLNQLLDDMADLVSRSLGEMITVKVVRGDALWPVEVDPIQMESVVLNLAVNARDAMPSGGSLTIETSNAHLDADYAGANADVAPGDYVQLAVSDDGTGMQPDVVERAFEPFFTTKRMGDGTGLGLSMTYGFVKQSGGHVKIFSEPGQGTTIKVYLPRVATGTGSGDARLALDAVPQGAGENILVVEDDPDVRALAVRLLDELGYSPLEASDGAAALGLLGDTDGISLLMTDVVLPGGIGGDELARKITAMRPSVRVLYMSGYSENAILHNGRLDDGVHLLQKPFRKAELALKVDEALHTAGGV